MTPELSIAMRDAQSGHQELSKGWAWAKAHLMAGTAIGVKFAILRDQRSVKQNSFYWGVILKEISQQAKLNGIGAIDEGWHLFFKREHLGYRFTKTKLPGRKRPSITRELRSTTKLSVKKMSEYLEKVIAQAVTDFGVQFSERNWEEWVDPETGEILEAHR